MSLRIGRSIGNVWDVVVEDRYVKANLSTAQKDSREESGYRHMSWHTRFVGNAYEKAKTLTDKTRIEIPDGDAKIENRYDKETGKLYVTLVVFDFNLYTPPVQTEAE